MSPGAESGGMPETPPGEPAPGPLEADPEARRPPQLSVLLAVIAASQALAMFKGLADRAQLLREIPQLTPTLFAVWMAAAALAIAGALGLWRLRRWGLYLIGLSWALAVIVDLAVGATNHAFLVTGMMWLVVLFVRPVRAALK